MTTYNWQVQRSPDAVSWSDVSGASGTFDATSPFSHDVPYTIQSGDANDYLRLKVTRVADGVIKYSGLVGPAGSTPPPAWIVTEAGTALVGSTVRYMVTQP